jgi:hypothetical protein
MIGHARTRAQTAGRRRVFDAMRAHRLADIMTEPAEMPAPHDMVPVAESNIRLAETRQSEPRTAHT